MTNEITELLDRFYIMLGEVGSGLTAYRLPPLLKKNTTKAIYPVSPPAYREQFDSESIVIATYVWKIEMLIAPVMLTARVNDGSSNQAAAKAAQDTSTCFSAFMDYFNDHRYLSTTALDDLDFVANPVLIASEGYRMFEPVVDLGNFWHGSIFTITIETAKEVD